MQLSFFKKCSKCGKSKLFTDFSKNKSMPDGHQYWCKACRNEGYATQYKERHKETMHQIYLANREHLIQYQREYQTKNKDIVLPKRREYFKGRGKQLHKKWLEQHPEKKLAYKQKYRAKKHGNGGSFTDSEWIALCAKYGNVCLCCLEIKPLEPDHVIPVSKGGTSDIDNIQPLCKICNAGKRDKTIDYRR